MLARLLDRLWGPEISRRELYAYPTYGWIHTGHGITQVLFSLHRIATGRRRGWCGPRVSWVADWETGPADKTSARKGTDLPVTEEAVRNGTWNVLACVLLRNEIHLDPVRDGLPQSERCAAHPGGDRCVH